MPDYITKTVQLDDLTRQDGQRAIECLDELYDAYEVPDKTRQLLWDLHCVVLSDVLIRFGVMNPEIGYPEQDGQS